MGADLEQGWKLGDGLEDDLMDRMAKAEAATDLKDVLIHIGHAHISLIHTLYLKTIDDYDFRRAAERFEQKLDAVIEELRAIRESANAQGT